MAGEDAAAAANYERIIKQKPHDVEAYLALGLLHEKHGDWQKAEQIYRKAHEAEPVSHTQDVCQVCCCPSFPRYLELVLGRRHIYKQFLDGEIPSR